jgi:hypothetical protein
MLEVFQIRIIRLPLGQILQQELSPRKIAGIEHCSPESLVVADIFEPNYLVFAQLLKTTRKVGCSYFADGNN